MTVNPSGGLVGRGHPLGATGLAQVVEMATQLRGRAGARQVDGARLGLAVNTGGIIDGDAGFVGIHAVACRCRRDRHQRSRGWGIAVPDKVVTNDDLAVSLDTSDAWITERTGIRERRIGGTTSGLAIEAGRKALRSAGLAAGRHRARGAGHDDPRQHGSGHGPHGPERPRHQGRRLRHQRGVLGLRLRPRRRGRPDRRRGGPDPAHRLRHPLDGSPTGTTARSPSLWATAPAPS